MGTLNSQQAQALRGISEQRLAANRANAARSTGPRTVAGKEIVARNAVTHGLLCENVRIGEFPDEIREVFDAFRDMLISRLEPEGQIEQLLAERIVSGAWRLRRVGRMEGLLTAEAMRSTAGQAEIEQLIAAEFDPEPKPKDDLARAVAHLFHRGTYEQLSRYETRIERGMYKALHELQRLQARRRGELVVPPLAVDVDVSGTI